MADATTTVKDLRDQVAAFVAARAWAPFHRPKELAVGLTLEAAELLEVFQWQGDPATATVRADAARMRRIGDELADVLNYVCCLANALDLDLSAAFARKLEENAAKYPVERARGNAEKYTRLGGDPPA